MVVQNEAAVHEEEPVTRGRAAPKVAANRAKPASSAARKRQNVTKYSSSYTNIAAFPAPCHKSLCLPLNKNHLSKYNNVGTWGAEASYIYILYVYSLLSLLLT